MDPLECPVTWPTDATAGDLMPDYIRPQHYCSLPADHVSRPENHEALQHRRTLVILPPMPHRCLCGSWAPVRDVEPAR